jgi:aspartyl-tRNA(Asn)/glutamyl-tRNA(Gln) amidotransferase subunit A
MITLQRVDCNRESPPNLTVEYMTTKSLEFATISEIGALIRSNELSSVALTTLMLDRIERLDGRLNAFITVTSELALKQAALADRELASGLDRGPLHGLPIAIKDLIATNGILTTGGSKYYAAWTPDADAAVVTRLYAAGAVMLGKTNLHELAFGSTSINPYYGAVSNPWKLDHHPGGSSGGSAVAVAAGMAYAAIGTDTGCSVRQPAQCCGIVGHKSTFGLVSKAGVMPLIDSMDHVGPLTRTVRDAALVLRAIQGPDNDDPYSVDHVQDDYFTQMNLSLDGAVVGVPRQFFFSGGDPEVVGLVDQALKTFQDLGADVIDMDLPDVERAYREADVTFSEISQAHGAALADEPEAFSEALRRRYAAVTSVSDADYETAQVFRKEFRQQVAAVMGRCDVLAMPTSTVAAAPIAKRPRNHAVERRKNASIFNFTGQPAISIPCGFTTTGLPAGMMLVGAMFGDAKVFRFAHAFEEATPWHRRHPDIS